MITEDPNNDADIEWQRERLADELSYKSNISDGANWDDIYNHLEYNGTVGGNADFVWVNKVNGVTLTLASLGLPANLKVDGVGCLWTCRTGSISSINFNDGMFHLALANIYWGYGLGLFLHSVWDVGIGSIMGSLPFGP